MNRMNAIPLCESQPEARNYGGIGSRYHRWALALSFLAVAFLEALIAIAQHSAQGSAGIAVGIFLDRNYYAGFLEISPPFALMLGLTRLTSQEKRSEMRPQTTLRACCILSVAGTIFLGIPGRFLKM